MACWAGMAAPRLAKPAERPRPVRDVEGTEGNHGEERELVQRGFSCAVATHLGLIALSVSKRFFDRSPELLEEAVQETLARTCEHWERATRRGNPEAWVVRTAVNVCYEKLRQERRGSRPTLDSDLQRDDDEVVLRSLLVIDALRRLTDRQRSVVVWRYVLDRSVTDTGAGLGLSEAKVQDASHNGRKRLRQLLGDDWSDLL
jgi:RNA polymerase sigma factor (sigma-70 family)